MSIAYGGVIAFLFRGLNLVVALATVLVTSNSLEPADYGTFVLGLTVIGIVNAATGGLTAAAAYQVSNQKRPPGMALANGLTAAAGAGAIAVAAGAIGAAALGGEAGAVALPVGIAAAAVVLNGVIAGVFLGQNQIVRYNIALVAPPLVALIAVVVTLYALDQQTPEAVLTAFASGQLLSAAALLVIGGRHLLEGARLERSLIRHIVAFAALAGLSSGVSYLNYRADLFVVREFEGKEGVATYSLAVYIAESVWQVSGSLALATYPRVGALERRPAAELTARVMRHTLVLLGVICAALFAAAGLIQDILFSQYEGMASALRFILPGIVIYGLAQSFSGFYTYQRGLPWVAAIVAGTGLVLDMAFAFTLVPQMGVNGAALASALAYSLAMFGALAFFLRREHLSPSDIFHFGRSEIDDYRAFFARISETLGRGSAASPLGP